MQKKHCVYVAHIDLRMNPQSTNPPKKNSAMCKGLSWVYLHVLYAILRFKWHMTYTRWLLENVEFYSEPQCVKRR